MREEIAMTAKELDRLHILRQVKEKKLSQIQAGSLLKISDRQIRTLLKRVETEGPRGIISRRAGARSNRRMPEGIKANALNLITEKYKGYGPTLAREKLEEYDGIKASAQTVRNWMLESGLWTPRRKRKRRLHPPRARRECFGELIQCDGSRHRWFGPENEMVNLTVFVDDATSKITALVFSKQESLNGYYEALQQHLEQYGCPRALYTDHWASFREQQEMTQMQRALTTFDIELILAHSPQAKGRVERQNRTLQDRLEKELRLRGIKTIEEANVYAREFLKAYNEKFSKEPASTVDAHRPSEGYDLDRILCVYEERSLDHCGIFQFKNCHYQLQEADRFSRLAKRKIEVRVQRDGNQRFFLNDCEVKALRLSEIQEPWKPTEMTQKEACLWSPRKSRPVSKKHPWKRGCGYKPAMGM